MAGSLVLIDSETASNSASISLTGISATYDVYQVVINNVHSVDDNVGVYLRVTTGGTADSDSEYDYANKGLRADTTFDNNSAENQDKALFGIEGTGTGESMNGVFYLFNFNNASEYSFLTNEVSYRNSAGVLKGDTGGIVHTVAEANDGVSFYMDSGNIDNGEFKLYGLRK